MPIPKKAAARELDARKYEILARYKLPPLIFGAKPRGPKPKVTQAKVEKAMFKFIEKATGEKLKAYQREMMRTIWRAYPDVPTFFGHEQTPSEFPALVVKRSRSPKR